MYRKPRSTQKARHQASSGHVRRSPTGHDPHRADPAQLSDFPSGTNTAPHFGPREGRECYPLDRVTTERARTRPHALAKRFTKFIQNMTGQVKVPRVIGPRIPGEARLAGDQPESLKALDVGQIPED